MTREGRSFTRPVIDQRPIKSLKAKIRALTPRTSQQDLGYVLTRLNQVTHGWANYFRHAVANIPSPVGCRATSLTAAAMESPSR